MYPYIRSYGSIYIIIKIILGYYIIWYLYSNVLKNITDTMPIKCIPDRSAYTTESYMIDTTTRKKLSNNKVLLLEYRKGKSDSWKRISLLTSNVWLTDDRRLCPCLYSDQVLCWCVLHAPYLTSPDMTRRVRGHIMWNLLFLGTYSHTWVSQVFVLSWVHV